MRTACGATLGGLGGSGRASDHDLGQTSTKARGRCRGSFVWASHRESRSSASCGESGSVGRQRRRGDGASGIAGETASWASRTDPGRGPRPEEPSQAAHRDVRLALRGDADQCGWGGTRGVHRAGAGPLAKAAGTDRGPFGAPTATAVSLSFSSWLSWELEGDFPSAAWRTCLSTNRCIDRSAWKTVHCTLHDGAKQFSQLKRFMQEVLSHPLWYPNARIC